MAPVFFWRGFASGTKVGSVHAPYWSLIGIESATVDEDAEGYILTVTGLLALTLLVTLAEMVGTGGISVL